MSTAPPLTPDRIDHQLVEIIRRTDRKELARRFVREGMWQVAIQIGALSLVQGGIGWILRPNAFVWGLWFVVATLIAAITTATSLSVRRTYLRRTEEEVKEAWDKQWRDLAGPGWARRTATAGGFWGAVAGLLIGAIAAFVDPTFTLAGSRALAVVGSVGLFSGFAIPTSFAVRQIMLVHMRRGLAG